MRRRDPLTLPLDLYPGPPATGVGIEAENGAAERDPWLPLVRRFGWEPVTDAVAGARP